MRRSRVLVLAAVLLSATVLAGCAGGGGDEGDGPTDSDGDGLPDRTELTGHNVRVTTRDGSETRRVTSDPNLEDTDGDGLNDYDESLRETDPQSVDTDGDLLLDGHNQTLDAGDARVAQWRALGLLEDPPLTFLGELGFCRPLTTLKPNQWSSDRPISDQLGDGEELLGWNVTLRGQTTHVASDPCSPDGDRDGLMDHLERELGTHPNVADTDGDEAPDGHDVDPLWNLKLALENVRVSGANRTALVELTVGSHRESAAATDAPAQLVVDPTDLTISRDSYVVEGLLTVTDEQGEPLRVFPGGAAQIAIALDLVTEEGQLRGGSTSARAGETVVFEGEDGAITFTWRTVRA